jgi:hypothetical protein
MECFETAEVKCSETPTECRHIFSLETAVIRIREEENLHSFVLQHHETCFFSKQDSLFWVKVVRENMNQAATLVPLMSLRKLHYSIRQRLILSERKKQRSRLRESPTSCAQGEAVLVLSTRRTR